ALALRLVFAAAGVGDAIEHAVDERRALGARVALGDLHRLVDDHGARDLGVIHQLPGAQPQHVAGDRVHALDAPVGARLHQLLVEPPAIAEHAAHRRVGVAAALGVARELAPEVTD